MLINKYSILFAMFAITLYINSFKQSKMDFKLNDRKGSKQLSDRIIDSAEEVFSELISLDFVQKFLMKCQMSGQHIAIAHRRMKDAADNDPAFYHAIHSLFTLTDIEEEKVFFKNILQSFEQQVAVYQESTEQLFGKPVPEIINAPISIPMYGYNQMMYYYGSKGQFLEVLTVVLGTFQVNTRLNAYLKQNPSYKPNKMSEVLCLDQFDLEPLVDILRAMIDRRSDQVSEEEVLMLSDIFRRVIAYERAVDMHEYSGSKWFEH